MHGSALFGLTSGFVLLSGCTFKPVDTLKSQAAFDLRCPEDKLQFTPLTGDCEGTKVGTDYDCTYGVRCGESQVSYSHVPRSNTWIANAASTPK